MKKLMLILLFAVSAAVLQADIISVNFAQNEGQFVLAEEAAGLAGYEAENFNNFSGASGSGELVDQFGNTTPAFLTYTSSNMWGDGTAGTDTPDGKLSSGYLDDGVTTAPYGVDISVSGVPYAQYTVIVYHATDGADGYVDVTVNGQTQNCPTTDRWGELGEWIEGVNCLVFTGVSGESVDIQVLNRDGSMRGSVAGFQIVYEVDAFRTSHPVPALWSDWIPAETTLEWTGPTAYEASDYTIYADPNRLLVEDGDPGVYFLASTFETSQAVSLENGTTYYWRVDASDPNIGGDPAVYQGRIWSFTTEPAEVLLDENPVSLTVMAGQTAEFTLAATNAQTYQWYKDDAPLSDGGNISGATTDTLVIDDVQLADEGFYHCVVSNEVPSEEVTSAARLMIGRMIAHWPLNGTLEAIVSNSDENWDGVYVDPNEANPPGVVEYVDGADGSPQGAVKFNGEAVVQIPDSAEFFNFHPQGLTLTAWVLGPSAGNWHRPVNKGGSYGIVHQEAGWIDMIVEGAPWQNVVPADKADVWRFVAMTYDPESQQRTVYSVYDDGGVVELLQSSTLSQTTVNAGTTDLIIGGASATDAEFNYHGTVDDVRIYNYPLDSEQILQIHSEINDENVCVEFPALDIAGPEGVGPEYRDCRVDIYDFAAMVETWLNCNLVPDCIE